MKYLTKWIEPLIVSIIAIIAPIKTLILTLTMLIVVDFIFGIYRAFRKGEPITSRKMSQSLPKILLYNIVIIVLYYTDHYVLQTGMQLEKLAAALICLVELKSIDESWTTVFGWSIWTKVIDGLSRGKSKTKDLI